MQFISNLPNPSFKRVNLRSKPSLIISAAKLFFNKFKVKKSFVTEN